ncbi:hypothetical protein AMTR_s00029p00160250 [Amborella trichopoda]|uniref:Uncharacterized protein n=1 Tax=Amborella trichopoda TaxID=13333 RepID=W1PPB2_AMBTC|nr:hypothetical protein AMTR_s00029p00160250 [Amborella trichopoda]
MERTPFVPKRRRMELSPRRRSQGEGEWNSPSGEDPNEKEKGTHALRPKEKENGTRPLSSQGVRPKHPKRPKENENGTHAPFRPFRPSQVMEPMSQGGVWNPHPL